MNVSSQARTKRILCKPLREQNVRLIIGLSAVYHRYRERSSLLAPLVVCLSFEFDRLFQPVTRATAGEAWKDSAAAAVAGAYGTLRIDTLRQAERGNRHRKVVSSRY